MRVLNKWFSSVCIVIITLTNNATAQRVYRDFEYGIGLGASNYYGDINQSQNFDGVQYGGSLFFKNNFSDYISLKILGSYARIAGSDKYNTNTFQKQRNLSFVNDMGELSLMGEFNFLRFRPGDYNNWFTPYLNFGVGVLMHSPYAYLDKKKYYLRPLGTEGQNLEPFASRKYGKYTMVLPVGIGFKFWLNGPFTIGADFCYRFTNTDYMDDVSATYIGSSYFPLPDPSDPYPNIARALQDRSAEAGIAPVGEANKQRGVSSTKDHYLMAQLTLSYRLSYYACPSR